MSSNAQVWQSPATSCTTLLGNSTKPFPEAAGVSVCPVWVTEAYPVWPLSAAPQHWTSPPTRRAHVCLSPGAMLTTLPFRAMGSCEEGNSSFPMLSSVGPRPRPSWPSSCKPQQLAVPSSRTAHVVSTPAWMDTARNPPGSCTKGAALASSSSPTFSSLPNPRRPSAPKPQQRTCPVSKRAHVCDRPVEMSANCPAVATKSC